MEYGSWLPMTPTPTTSDFSVINPARYMIDISGRMHHESVSLNRLTSDLLPLAMAAGLTLSIGAWALGPRGWNEGHGIPSTVVFIWLSPCLPPLHSLARLARSPIRH